MRAHTALLQDTVYTVTHTATAYSLHESSYSITTAYSLHENSYSITTAYSLHENSYSTTTAHSLHYVFPEEWVVGSKDFYAIS